MTRAGRWAARPVARQPGPLRVVVELGREALYAVEVSATPSRAWRAVFLRPPRRPMTEPSAGDAGRIELRGATVSFRTAPARLDACVRRIDCWIRYANSVVAE
jgi:hypothetical protein